MVAGSSAGLEDRHPRPGIGKWPQGSAGSEDEHEHEGHHGHPGIGKQLVDENAEEVEHAVAGRLVAAAEARSMFEEDSHVEDKRS